uniref:Ankyrin repeat protein n=1 Tax=Pithovirus LCPAC101 TaxID=2506586 RepID=A0A481Z5Y3_9VIRU|nr:MAG: ankyrin repeat protein [Pithovirus LCPAC101]
MKKQEKEQKLVLDYRTMSSDLDNIYAKYIMHEGSMYLPTIRNNKLIVSIELNKIWIVYKLVHSKYDIKTMECKAFRRACIFVNSAIVKLFLDLPIERGIDPSVRNNICLRGACELGNTEIVRVLLEPHNLKRMNLSSDMYIVLIHSAVYSKNKEIVRILYDTFVKCGGDRSPLLRSAIFINWVRLNDLDYMIS